MRTLFWRVFLSQVLVIGLAFGTMASRLSTTFYDSSERLAEAQFNERALSLAHMLKPVIDNPPSRPQLQLIADLTSASTNSVVCIQINAGRERGFVGPRGRRTGPGPGVAAATTGATLIYGAAANPCGENMMLVKVPFPEGRGALYLSSSLPAAIDDSVKLLRRLLLYAGVVGVGLALLVALALSGQIARPLRRVTGLAQRMGSGDFSQRLDIRGKDEIGVLASSFDKMADSLDHTLASLHAEQARLRGILASVAEGIIAVDTEGSVVLLNPQAAALLGLAPGVSGGLDSIGLPADVAGAFSESLSTNEMRSLEFEHGRPARQLVLQVAPVRAGEAGRWGAVAVVRDVTEARRLDEMRKRFISDASHEIRTPLTAIGGFASAILDGAAATDEERARAAAFIVRETERLSRLVNDLLDLSRMESGAVELHLEETDLTELIRETVEGFLGQAQERGITIELDLPSDLPPLHVDPDRIYQVMVNFVTNALRYNRPHGQVTISAVRHDGSVSVTVRDTGIGIPASELPRIWERFHRADTARARSDGGTGLGLAIVRSIIQKHGGTVSAESEVGVGSAFSFALPLR